MCVNILLLDDLDEPPGCCTNLHVPSIEHHNAWPRCQELARILRGPAGLERCLDAGNGSRIWWKSIIKLLGKPKNGRWLISI